MTENTSPFTYPTVDYHTRTPAQERYSALRTRLQALVASLEAAEKSKRRSPLKWTPIVARLSEDVERTKIEFEAAEAAQSQEYEIARKARHEVIQAGLSWAIEQVGKVERPGEGQLALRVADADGGDDILVYSTSLTNFEAAWVKKGTNEIVNRFGYINGPDERYSRSADQPAVSPATINTWSASTMTPDEATDFATAIRVLAFLADKINEAFGL